MSILIKGIDAPEYGYIEIRLYDDRAECELQEHVYTDLEIEEVPTPHGDLIDRDKIYIPKSQYADTGAYISAVYELRNAPTVIEAEGKNARHYNR